MSAAALAGGGAERALLDTGVLLHSRGHHVSVLTFDDGKGDAYEVPPGMSRAVLNVPGRSSNRLHGLINNLRRMLMIRAYVRRTRPDVMVSYLTRANVLCLLALAGTGVPVIVTEHNVPALRDAPMHRFWSALRRALYKLAAQVVVVSRGLAEHYRWVPAGRLSVIYNMLRDEEPDAGERHDFLDPRFQYIVGMGRLEPEKRFDALIQAFKLIEAECPDWKLLILGEGSQRNELARSIDSLGLNGRVLVPGRVVHPRSALRRCGLFALSSESEGFPLVLLEAMSVGLAVVSFDCDFGPREIIANDSSGLLVPAGDIPALAKSLLRLVSDVHLRTRLAAGGAASVSRFQPQAILPQWEELIGRVAAVSDGSRRG
jgi:glycosyltransferase involved in cell wall biosynthesis